MAVNRYILTLSCNDTKGIVAAVSGFLAEHDGFIIESAQFGDPYTKRFFMRTEFESGKGSPNEKSFKELFVTVAQQFKMDWNLHNVSYKPRVMIMVSKTGHCLNNLLYRKESGNLKIEVPLIVSNHEILKPLADRHGVNFTYLPVNQKTKQDQENRLWELIEKEQIDVVVLARYMQILSADLCKKLKGRAINIHHSFLPGFKGADPYKQAYDRGVKIIGATAHYVTSELDEGPIIEQEVIRVTHADKPEDLKTLGQDIESRVLSHAVKYHIERRVLLNDGKTVVFN